MYIVLTEFEFLFSQNHAYTEVPRNVTIKVQLLSFASALLQPYTTREPQDRGYDLVELDEDRTKSRQRRIPVSEAIHKFIKLCTLAAEEMAEARWPEERCTDLVAQLMLQATIEAYRADRDNSSQVLADRRIFLGEHHSQAEAIHDAMYAKYLQPRPGIPPSEQLEEVAVKFPLPEVEETMIDFLVDPMGLLKTPILIQLERGKLDGLSREDTLALKDRVGLS